MSDVVLYRAAGEIAMITLNRPDRLNAWTPELGSRYEEELRRACDDPAIKAIVVTGSGRGFCAGADMEVLDAAANDSPPEEPQPHSWVRTLPKPVIAAINGPCAGVGLVMALACDMRFMAEEAKITTAFVRRGLVAEYGAAWLLVRSVGPSRALDVLLSGRLMLAAEALELGLVDRVHPGGELLDATLEYARSLAELSSPWSMAVMKRQVYEAMESDLPAAEASADELMQESFGRPDLAEGVASFREQRPPRFPPLEA